MITRIDRFSALLIALSVSSVGAIAQWDVDNTSFPQVAAKASYTYQTAHFLGVEAAVGDAYGNIHVGNRGVGLGLRAQLGGTPIWGATVFAERGYILAGIRLSSTVWFKGSAIDVRVTPELGVAIFGAFDITYAYSIPVNRNRFMEVSNNSLNIRFAFLIKRAA